MEKKNVPNHQPEGHGFYSFVKLPKGNGRPQWISFGNKIINGSKKMAKSSFTTHLEKMYVINMKDQQD